MRKLKYLLLLLGFSLSAAPVPTIYSTDLFHPHEDPDDHFDLATLFALPELELKAIVLDQSKRQRGNPGTVPLRQMLQITGREVPFATGLGDKLHSPDDPGRNQPAQFQGGIELLLKVLREASSPVTVITAGSVRDICAAWNREPDLLKQKVGRLYLNIGSADPRVIEYNVGLDTNAYIGILRSGLPIFLCYCLPMKREETNSIYSTWWRFREGEVLETAPLKVQNFFIYALQRPAPDELDPAKALEMDLRPWRRLVWEMERNMWCTAPFLHAANRPVYRVGGKYTLIRPRRSASPEKIFEFLATRVEVDPTGKTQTTPGGPNPNVQLFKVLAADRYAQAMKDCLGELVGSLGR